VTSQARVRCAPSEWGQRYLDPFPTRFLGHLAISLLAFLNPLPGSAVVAGLSYLHQSLVARGHPGGLHVTVADGDTISVTIAFADLLLGPKSA
jgi:hypothetical protein